MVDDVRPDETLDCRGLSCPMPLLKTKKTVGKMKSDQILEILGTDPGTKNDLPGFASKARYAYLGEKEDDGFTRFYLKVNIVNRLRPRHLFQHFLFINCRYNVRREIWPRNWEFL